MSFRSHWCEGFEYEELSWTMFKIKPRGWSVAVLECYNCLLSLKAWPGWYIICIKKNLSDQVEKALQLFEYSALSFFTLCSSSSERSRSTFQTTWSVKNGAGSAEKIHSGFSARCVSNAWYDRRNEYMNAIPHKAPRHQFLETKFACKSICPR